MIASPGPVRRRDRLREQDGRRRRRGGGRGGDGRRRALLQKGQDGPVDRAGQDLIARGVRVGDVPQQAGPGGAVGLSELGAGIQVGDVGLGAEREISALTSGILAFSDADSVGSSPSRRTRLSGDAAWMACTTAPTPEAA